MAAEPQAPVERPPAEGAALPPLQVTLVAHHVGKVGGMERVLTELALGLRRLGWDVTIVAFACELPASSGVTFHRVRGPKLPFVLYYPWFMLAGSFALWRVRRRGRGGVVLATGAILLNRVDLVAVHYCQHVGPATPSRTSWPFRVNARISALLTRTAEKVCFPLNDPRHFVCVSEGVAEEIREYFPKLADRAITIPNGVDVDAFAPGSRSEAAATLRETLAIATGRPVAIFVGGEWERKGLEQLIRALVLAPEWDLLVVGNGDSERYGLMARELGVERAIRWIGVSRDVAPLYQLADAFVFPTTYEAFPLVALEAAASGLPILAAPVNGVRELVQDGVSGYLISRDPGDIAARLRELGADPGLRARFGDAARQAALEYSWEKMVQRHDELYRGLLAPRSRD